jgi:hypothetical protein
VKTTFQTLERLNISLTTVLENNDDYENFIKLVSMTISYVADPGLSADQFKGSDEDTNKEIESLWNEILLQCRTIQFLLLNFSSESNKDLISKIDDTIESLKQGDKKASISIFLRYLTLPDTLRRICTEDSKDLLDKLLEIFNVLADRKTHKLIALLGKSNSLIFNNQYISII